MGLCGIPEDFNEVVASRTAQCIVHVPNTEQKRENYRKTECTIQKDRANHAPWHDDGRVLNFFR